MINEIGELRNIFVETAQKYGFLKFEIEQLILMFYNEKNIVFYNEQYVYLAKKNEKEWNIIEFRKTVEKEKKIWRKKFQ